ncbi:hypothetical protein [Actinoplanes derwentensis]|uniref:hypothetical protein n=1 Tax=Actinoplanes derwentensis TaxID=113562 RepID=UPI000B80AD53|nr:hypothetical protein [Actinoplanes derwentensis]
MNSTGWFIVGFPVAGGEVLQEAGLGALALLVGGLQAHAQLVGGLFHAAVVEAGDGEQLDVPLSQRPSIHGERGKKFVEEDAEFLVGRAVGHGRRWSAFAGFPGLLGWPGLSALGVGDAALDQFHAEVRRPDVDGRHPFQEAVEQVMVDVGGVVAVGQNDALARAAQAASGEADREEPVRLGSRGPAGAGDDGGPDLVALGVVGVFEQEPQKHAGPHVPGRQAGTKAIGRDGPVEHREAVLEPVEQRPVPSIRTVPVARQHERGQVL